MLQTDGYLFFRVTVEALSPPASAKHDKQYSAPPQSFHSSQFSYLVLATFLVPRFKHRSSHCNETMSGKVVDWLVDAKEEREIRLYAGKLARSGRRRSCSYTPNHKACQRSVGFLVAV